MRRKHTLFLLIALFATSCTKQKIVPFRLSPEFYTSTNSGINYKVNYSDNVITKADAKASFAVYVYSVGCSACNSFSPHLQTYLTTNNIMMYAVTLSEVQAGGGDLYKAGKYTPYVSLFNKGKIVATLDPLSDKHTAYFKSAVSFGEWFETYVDISPN